MTTKQNTILLQALLMISFVKVTISLKCLFYAEVECTNISN